MKKIYNSYFKRDFVHVQPGEYFVSKEYGVYTLLGSCISVVLYSEEQKIGGMNHFMLPSTSEVNNSGNECSGRYGIYAMELLINNLMHEGVVKKNIMAKVFGGGNVLYTNTNCENNIGAENSKFVFDFLATENISVVSKNVGGNIGRKIYYFPETGKVLVSEIRKIRDIAYLENNYNRSIAKNLNDSTIILFKK